MKLKKSQSMVLGTSKLGSDIDHYGEVIFERG